MAHTPPGPPPGRKTPSQGPPIGDDYGDFEGDPTSINQIPQGPSGATPRAGGMTPPQNFSQGSPPLSHMGQPFSVQTQTSPPNMMQPGPPMTQVSGMIAQPTPYVSRSRIYAFVVDETGMPIELGSGRFAKAYLGEERWVESKTTLRRPVAIKCLKSGVTSADQMRFQIQNEMIE